MGVKHIITTGKDGKKITVPSVYRSLLKQAVIMTLKSENVDMPCVVNIMITDDAGIRVYNKNHRNIDKATDVLSFPMQEFSSEGWQGIVNTDIDIDTQTVPLGDIVISVQTIKRNARKYKHSYEQESVHMMIHSTLHLLGYDHGGIMQGKENVLLVDMGYVPEDAASGSIFRMNGRQIIYDN